MSDGSGHEVDPKTLRNGVRVDVRFSCTYHARNVKGKGRVENISPTGALIEDAEPLLLSGGTVRLRFAFGEGCIPVEVKADVVRETPTGFAVRFASMNARVKALLKIAIRRFDESQEAASGLL